MEKAKALLEKLRRFEVEFKLEKQQFIEKYNIGSTLHDPTQQNDFHVNEWSRQMMVTVKLVLSQVMTYFADDNEAVNGYAHEVVKMLINNLVANPEENLTKNLQKMITQQLDDRVNVDEVIQPNLNQPNDILSRDQLNTSANFELSPSANEIMQLTNSSVTEQSVDQQVMGGNGDQVINHENGSGGEDDAEMSNSANDNHDGAVVASNEPSTSARPRSNRVTSKQSTASTARKLNKRKQSQPNRTGKRSKNTVEVNDGGEDEDGDDIANENREEAKVKVVYLNCTQSNCNVKLDSMVHLNDHLSTVHQLAPLQCFATNCNARFDNSTQLGDHITLHHQQDTRFLCAVCPKELDSQHKAYLHWYRNHQTGHFKCNFVSDCAQVTDTRRKMTTHQNVKHHSQSKHLHCTHPGCTASFSSNFYLKRHELIHLATNQFHCNWPHCSKQCKQRANLVKHIRMCHFGLPQSMKAQKEKNIVDLRDPNEYVRVVVDE